MATESHVHVPAADHKEANIQCQIEPSIGTTGMCTQCTCRQDRNSAYSDLWLGMGRYTPPHEELNGGGDEHLPKNENVDQTSIFIWKLSWNNLVIIKMIIRDTTTHLCEAKEASPESLASNADGTYRMEMWFAVSAPLSLAWPGDTLTHVEKYGPKLRIKGLITSPILEPLQTSRTIKVIILAVPALSPMATLPLH